MEIENVLNKELGMYAIDLLIINKLSIYFCEDKTECILFCRGENLSELNITYNINRIKHYHIVEYLCYCLNANLGRSTKSYNS